MIFIDRLIDSLVIWDDKVGQKRVTRLDGLISAALLVLGSDDYKQEDYAGNSVKYLKERLKVLTEKENIGQDFLVKSLIVLFTEHFNDAVEKREKHISNNISLLEKARKVNQGSLDSLIEETEYQINFMQSEDYITITLNEKTIWDDVMSKNFNKQEIEHMTSIMAHEDIQNNREGMSEPEIEKFLDILKSFD